MSFVCRAGVFCIMSNHDHELQQLQDFLARHPKIVVLSGAGISASSGIATYRDGEGRWLYSTPIQHRDFLQEASVRQRYWTRSWFGWPTVRDARSNAAHRALATLEQRGMVNLVITQNVDRLHQRAGSHAVIDLHGRLDRVVCLNCSAFSAREVLQQRLGHANPHLAAHPRSLQQRPDGDMALPDALAANTHVPVCEDCGGTLKPDVVFFGGNVPSERVAHSHSASRCTVSDRLFTASLLGVSLLSLGTRAGQAAGHRQPRADPRGFTRYTETCCTVRGLVGGAGIDSTLFTGISALTGYTCSHR
jgi:NAD-dependent SIR2 family protein deacetylase